MSIYIITEPVYMADEDPEVVGPRGCATVHPAKCSLTIAEIALKDVSKGSPFAFVTSESEPSVPFFRDAWSFDFDLVTDGVGMGSKDFWEAKKNGTLPEITVTTAGREITIDMDVAKHIARNHIRYEREQVFTRLDVEYMRASEAKDESKMETVAALKQVLRDLPADPRIEAAQTPEELEHLAITAISEAVAKSKDNTPVED